MAIAAFAATFVPWLLVALRIPIGFVPLSMVLLLTSLTGLVSSIVVILMTPAPTTRILALVTFCVFYMSSLFHCGIIMAARPHNRPGSTCLTNLNQIGKAMFMYREENEGYFPFDERGPLHSLSLLYPHYMRETNVFQCPVAARIRRKGEAPVTFPEDTSLGGIVSDYGYAWHVPKKPPPRCPVVADMPGNHGNGFNVVFADYSVCWEREPFMRDDPADNIFAPEPGWSADTDSYIRQEP